jgi:hypothetical protein
MGAASLRLCPRCVRYLLMVFEVWERKKVEEGQECGTAKRVVWTCVTRKAWNDRVALWHKNSSDPKLACPTCYGRWLFRSRKGRAEKDWDE